MNKGFPFERYCLEKCEKYPWVHVIFQQLLPSENVSGNKN